MFSRFFSRPAAAFTAATRVSAAKLAISQRSTAVSAITRAQRRLFSGKPLANSAGGQSAGKAAEAGAADATAAPSLKLMPSRGVRVLSYACCHVKSPLIRCSPAASVLAGPRVVVPDRRWLVSVLQLRERPQEDIKCVAVCGVDDGFVAIS